jgi:hypothetical protein
MVPSPILGETSGSEAVLVEQAAKTVGSHDTVPVLELPYGQVGDWLLEVDAAVWAPSVALPITRFPSGGHS